MQSSFSVDSINIIELIGTTIVKIGSILLSIYKVVYAVVHFLLELTIVLFIAPLVEFALWDWIQARFSDQYIAIAYGIRTSFGFRTTAIPLTLNPSPWGRGT